MKRLKIDRTFAVALILVVSAGIYIISLSTENHRNKQILAQMEENIRIQQRILEQYELNYLELFKRPPSSVVGFYRYENGKIPWVKELPRQKIVLYCPKAKNSTGQDEKYKLIQRTLRSVPANALCIITDRTNAPGIRQLLNQPVADVFIPDEESGIVEYFGNDMAFMISTSEGLRGYLKINEFNQYFIQKYLKYLCKSIY